jgi:hypothetical protein
MDLAQVFILDLGWVFLALWGMVLAAVCAIAFGGEFFTLDEVEKPQRLKASWKKTDGYTTPEGVP